MYKSKLQELCHRFSWQLPEYSYEKEGPNHNPHFTASVTVNGRSFRTPDHYSSSKLAQNEVAKLAILHLTDPQPSLPPATPSTVSAPSASSGHLSAGTGSEGTLPIRGTFQPKIPETLQNPQTNGTTSAVGDDKRSIALTDVHMYKNKLQNYAQKRNLTLPIYSCEHKGPPHDSRFKCKVTVDGQTFESPDFFHTVKEAKHAAAKVALMSLSTDGIQEDDSGFYKNLLQGLAQKEGFVLPIYDTNISGLSHKPTFVSTVKIGGEIFQGQEAKTKKQAEVSAAKVAYTTLTERKPSSPKFAPCSCIEAGPSSSSMSISDLEENVRHIAIEEQYDDYRAKDQKASETSSVNTKISTHYPLILSPTAGTWTRESRSSPDTGSSPDTVFAHARNPSPPVPALCEVGLTSPECATDLVFSDIKRPAGTSPLPCKRVLIFPRMPNMTFPAGVTPKNILPISNDEWVAVSWVPSQVDN